MLTYEKAKKLLSPGDIVYIIEGGRIVELPILKICQHSLTVTGGILYYDDVGTEWFLTKCCAKQVLKKELI